VADKGRDLKVSILSDADQFDLASPADDLERLGDAAGDAGRDLERLGDASRDLDDLGTAARSAGDDLDRLGRAGDDLDQVARDARKAGAGVDDLGDDATSAAKRVDGAMDKIAAASKRSAADVDKSMDKASKGLDEFKDEAAGTSREAAASFSGSFDDVASTVQEVAANAFSGFGALGMAGGIAAAAGIGFLVTSITEAREKVKELAAGLLDLKLDPDMDTAAGRVRQVLDSLKDAGDLERFRTAAKDAGISWSEYVRALAEGGPIADKVREQIRLNADEFAGLEGVTTSAGWASQDLYNRLNDQADASGTATASAAAYKEALEGLEVADESSVAIEGLTAALEGFVDPTETYTTLLADAEQAERDRAAATAQGTKDSTDDWTDYAKAVEVSVDDYISSLEDQVAAQEAWADNLATLARRGVTEGTLAELEKLGPEGAPLVAKLTKASDEELARLVAVMRRKGADSTEELAAGLRGGKPQVVREVQDVRDDMRRRLTGRIDVPVGVDGPSAGELARIRSGIRQGLSGITVTVDAIAQTALGRNVP